MIPLAVVAAAITWVPWRGRQATSLLAMMAAGLLSLLLVLFIEAVVYRDLLGSDWLSRGRSRLPGITAFIAAGWLVRMAVVTGRSKSDPALHLSPYERIVLQRADVLCTAGNYVEIKDIADARSSSDRH